MKIRLSDFYSLYRKYKVHIIGWAIFIFYEVVIVGLMRNFWATPGNYAIFFFFNIVLFYVHAHIFMPAAKMKTKHALWRMPLFIIIEVVIYIPITYGTVELMMKYGTLKLIGELHYDFRSLVNMSYRATYFILFSSGYYYIVSYFKERKLAEEREKEKLLVIIENQRIQADLIKSQHAHLKAQINPHFLFNTLNFIYTNTRKAAPEAAEAIMSLSEMMRYAMQEASDIDQTELMMELEQVENLIRLHQIKSERPLYIELEYDDETASMKIIPLLLLTLVENMFKHGDLHQKDHHAHIMLTSSGTILQIETKNLISAMPNGHSSHHIGLDNMKKRLQTVYGENASLETHVDEDHCFYVRIDIDTA